MPESQDFELDAALIRRRFSAHADAVRQGDFLAREVASRMAERLDYIRLQPARILDLGCGHGADLAALAQRYPDAQRIGLDFALPALQLAREERSLLQRLLGKKTGPGLVCADALALPLAHASMQMVWSNLLLHWLSDPLPALREIHRVLEVEGLLMFATLGPDTLKELRAVLPTHSGDRVHRFIDMHDLGDCLVQAGFSDPVMDMQTLTLTYPDADALWRDLRAAAATNASQQRPRSLSGKQSWQAACTALDASRINGRLTLSLELVFGHAWKPTPKHTADGRAIVRFQTKG